MKQENKSSKSKSIIMACIFAALSVYSNAQLNKCNDHFRVGLNVTNFVTGNGHGGMYNVGAVLNCHRSTISLGPTWQKAKKEFDGAMISYSFNVVGTNASCNSDGRQYNERGELSFFCTVSYYKKAILSNATIENEGSLSNEMLQHYNTLQINTIESYGGFSYSHLLNENFKVKLFIGMGFYTHLNFTENMWHNKSAPVLTTGIGINFLK